MEGAIKGHLAQLPCNKQGYFQLDLVAHNLEESVEEMDGDGWGKVFGEIWGEMKETRGGWIY